MTPPPLYYLRDNFAMREYLAMQFHDFLPLPLPLPQILEECSSAVELPVLYILSSLATAFISCWLSFGLEYHTSFETEFPNIWRTDVSLYLTFSMCTSTRKLIIFMICANLRPILVSKDA